MGVLSKVLTRHYGGSASSGGSVVTGPTEGFFAPIERVISDSGYYDAFPMPEQHPSGIIITLFKRSGSHAAAGPLMLNYYTSAGIEEEQVTVNNVPINSAAHSFFIVKTGVNEGRQIVCYQDDELYTSCKFAYRDGLTGTFTAGTAWDFGAGYSSSPSPIKMTAMPSGKIRFGYYSFGLTTNPAIMGFLDSTDDGETFTQGAIIDSLATQAPTMPYTDWKAHEFGWDIVVNTGVDATCECVLFARVNVPNDGGAPYKHYFSDDGGETWSYDATEDAGVGGPYSRHLLYKFPNSNSPLDVKLHHDGLVYVANGVRNATSGYKTYITTASPADALVNVFSDWSALVQIGPDGQAELTGQSIDYSYVIMFDVKASAIDTTPQKWCMLYDVSPEAVNLSLTDRRCRILLFQIT